jgi:rubrerythrin
VGGSDVKKIPWFEFRDNTTDEEMDKEFEAFWDYIKEYGTQEAYQYAYDKGDHNNMMLGGLGWDPPADIGPYTFLREYCRVLGFDTEDNRYICKKCGTKNTELDTGVRVCPICSNQ